MLLNRGKNDVTIIISYSFYHTYVNFSSGEGEVFEIAEVDKKIFETESACGASYFGAIRPHRVYYLLEFHGVGYSYERGKSHQPFGGAPRGYFEK